MIRTSYHQGWPHRPDHDLETFPGPQHFRLSPTSAAGNSSFQHFPPLDATVSPVPMSVTSESAIGPRRMDFDQPWDDDDDPDDDPRRNRTPIQIPNRRADIFDISTPTATHQVPPSPVQPPLPPPSSIPHPIPLAPMQPALPPNPFTIGTSSQLPVKHIPRSQVTRPFALPKVPVIHPPRPLANRPQKYIESSSPWKADRHDREIRDRPPRLF